MERDPAGSFFKFTLGFLTFIGVSMALTFAVNSYTVAQEQAQQTAAAFEALIK